jgi:hypothetical protein
MVIEPSSKNGVDLISNGSIGSSPYQETSINPRGIKIETRPDDPDQYYIGVDLTEADTVKAQPSQKISSLETEEIHSCAFCEKKYKTDYLTQLYVGSIAVVGLFIVYRIVQKSSK